MNLIMCISNNGGIAFNNRRQSRDEQVCRDMLAHTGGCLCMEQYSVGLFDGIADVAVCSDVSCLPQPYYFAERKMPKVAEHVISEVVLYHWNRDYPADVLFKLDMSGFRCRDTVEFAGKSHERIKREIWVREEIQ